MEQLENTTIDRRMLTKTLHNFAILLELSGANPFKVRAIIHAAETIEHLDGETVRLADIIQLAGIGKGIRTLVEEFACTGSFAEYRSILQHVPESLLEVTQLRGLGAKKVRLLWKELGVESINDLEKAAKAGKIATLKGFGAKTQANILQAIAEYREACTRFHVHTATYEAERLSEKFRRCHSVRSAEIVGELRQGEETVSQIVILLATQHFEQIVECCAHDEECSSGHWDGVTLLMTSTRGIPTRVQCVAPESFIIELHRYSSSLKFHTELLNKLANAISTSVSLSSEEELYHCAGIPYVPPELRYDPSVLTDNTLLQRLPSLVSMKDIRGAVHVHTTWSDGRHSIRQMAERARALGYEYIAICDHSRSASYANGLSEERVKCQHEEIDKLNAERIGIRILKGIESDILPDGSLDYPDSLLETFDIVVASVHSALTMTREVMTERIKRALEHPSTTILGHPTGRLLLKRRGYEVDWDCILETAYKHGKILEINANPYRLDISADIAAKAYQAGIALAINTDAHSCEDLGYMRFGLSVARRAGIPASAVVNTYSWKKIVQYMRERKMFLTKSDSAFPHTL
ncbi:MAG: DNA polymerase/3'-5' exonuclease PolX [Bacteroidota bacterium]|nr:DNA polymerase/3'-5' exonuclease PolX [Candidatus Kapabacteria bacterium]MDW8219098.1 DNA polymerase/3'-5' exonuclease PolX [Bacteroidota bacterium]